MNKQMSTAEMIEYIRNLFAKANAALNHHGVPSFDIDEAIVNFAAYKAWHEKALAVHDAKFAKLQAELSKPDMNLFEKNIQLQETINLLDVIEFTTKSYIMIMKVIAGGVEQQTLH